MPTSLFGEGTAINVNANGTLVTQSFTGTAGQTVYNIIGFTYTPGSNSLLVFINGQRQISGRDFFETSPSSFTLVEGVVDGDFVDIIGFPEIDLIQYPAGGAIFPVATIAALRLSPKALGYVFVEGYYTPGDGGGGNYYYDPLDVSSSDNGGSIIVGIDGGRWKIINQDRLTLRQFGAIGDFIADDTQSIIRWCAAIAGKEGFANAGDYRMTGPFAPKDGTTIIGEGIAATKFHTALDIEQMNADPAGTYNFTMRDVGFYNTFPVSNVAGPTPTGTTSIGSPQITAVSSIAGLQKGMQISGAGIPPGSYIHKMTAAVIYLCTSTGVPVNATGNNVATLLTTQFRQGQTKFHIHAFNAGAWHLDRVATFSAFTDNDYSPNNHAGIWLDRASSSQYFVNVLSNCWMHHGQILMGTSDSDIVNCTVWGNPFDYAVKIAAPNIRGIGGSWSAGVVQGALWITATGTEPFGAANHNFSGVNIDCGNVWYTGYGVTLTMTTGINFSGCKFNNIQKAAVYMRDVAGGTAFSGCSFFNNNLDGLGYGDIEVDNIGFQSTSVNVTGNNFFNNAATGTLGPAIKEINSGFYPAGCVYSSNIIAGGNYLTPGFTIATPVGSGQYPKILGNMGHGTETESIANPATNQYTGTLTGCTTAPTGAIKWSRNGNFITLSIPPITATSNSTGCSITGMPPEIRPASAQSVSAFLTDNSANVIGGMSVAPSGVITLFTVAAAGVFTAANTKGLQANNFTYQLLG